MCILLLNLNELLFSDQEKQERLKNIKELECLYSSFGTYSPKRGYEGELYPRRGYSSPSIMGSP